MEDHPFIPVRSLKTDVLLSPVWRVCSRTYGGLQVSRIVGMPILVTLKCAIVHWRFTASVLFNLHHLAIQYFRNRRGIERAAESEGCVKGFYSVNLEKLTQNGRYDVIFGGSLFSYIPVTIWASCSTALWDAD